MNTQEPGSLAAQDGEAAEGMWPSIRDEPRSGRVCWTHPTYDGVNETWRPRTRVVTTHPTIDAFVKAKRAEGWEVETFDEIATAADGRRYPVVALSLTRAKAGEAPQDDILHVWVEPVEAPATVGRLEWQPAPSKDGPRERFIALEGPFQAAVWRQASSGHWHAVITDRSRSKTVREWDAGDTRAQATSAAEQTLAALNQRRAAVPQ